MTHFISNGILVVLSERKAPKNRKKCLTKKGANDILVVLPKKEGAKERQKKSNDLWKLSKTLILIS